MDPMRIAIMGAGSLGTIFGAVLSSHNDNVELIDADQTIIETLNAHGASVQGAIELTTPVKALLPQDMSGQYDLIFLLTKQTHNHVVLPALVPHIHENTMVCSLQNGMPEDTVIKFIPQKHIIGGSVGFGATWIKPGVSKLTSSAEALSKFAFYLGEIDGSVTPRIEAVSQILMNIGYCKIIDNLIATKWTKILNNATFSGMSAALGCTFGDVLDNADAMYCLAHIADETIKTMKAHGHPVVKMQGEDMGVLELHSDQDIPSKMPVYNRIWGRHRQLKASMLQDLEKNRTTEIDYINGYVSRKGREAGMETPYNNMVVELVKNAEKLKEVPSFKINLARFVAMKKNRSPK